MHCQTVLWTGLVADDLDMSDDDRSAHEEARAALYRRIVDDGEAMSQPLSEGVEKGATAGIMTVAEPTDGGYLVSGRKIFASLAGAADAYNITCHVPDEEGLRFLSVRASSPGGQIVGDWDTLGMRATDSRTLLFDKAFVPSEDELLPADVYEQLAERWPHVYMTLTPTVCGGGSTMRKLRLEQHDRDARCGSLMLPWSAEVCLERPGRDGLFDDAE